LFFVLLAAAFAGCAALMAKLPPRRRGGAARLAGTRAALPWRVLGYFAATLVLYVGVENSLGGWLPTYAERLLPGGTPAPAAAARVSSVALCFWIGELAGRGLMAAVIRRVREAVLYRVCLLVVIAAVGVLVATPRMTAASIFAVTAVAAVSLAPLFPLGVSFLLARTGDHPQVGGVFAVSSLGGTILPWMMGVVSSHVRSLRPGFLVPAAGAAAMLVLSRYLPERPKSTSADK
jgi:fucose permease